MLLPRRPRLHRSASHGWGRAGSTISSDRAPQDLDGIEPRILSRLSWGLVADINQADLELRLNIILKKLEALPEVAVPEDVVMFLAKRISSNVR